MSLPALVVLAGLLGAPADSATAAPATASFPAGLLDTSGRTAPTTLAIAEASPGHAVAPTPLQAALASLVLPGAGQWWTGHPIRGSILGGMELWLYGDALQRCLSSIPELRKERDQIRLAMGDEVWRQILEGDTTESARRKLATLQDSLSDASGRANISTDYVHSEIAWAFGVHAWGVVDAAESAWLRRGGRRPVRSMSSSAWASAFVPGLGQILNGRYSKAALLYMGVAGAVVSFEGRQSMVEFWKTESDIAAKEGRSTTIPNEQADFFRKRRNQYAWGLGLIYVYQILDAAVDARLSRMDSSPLSLEPSLLGPGLVATWRF